MVVGYGKRGALACRALCGENGSAESRESIEVVKAQSRRFRVSPEQAIYGIMPPVRDNGSRHR